MPAFTKEKIIEQFKSVHGSRYDYSLVEYKGDKAKVKIICKEHGVFEQWVQGHKKGSGCRQCAITSLKPRYTTEQIIEQFKKKHGDRFDYSKVNYTHALDKVKIICRIHGEFEQLVGMHRKGQGCAECMYDGKRHTIGDVLNKFIKVHGTRYDYSLVHYINVDTKVKIICKTHGVFKQSPEKHLNGNGCPKCIGRNQTESEILEKFKKIHGDRYDYSMVKFKMVTKKIQIQCNEHGIFFQSPQDHIAGSGCAKCAGVVTLTNKEVLEAFAKTHGQKYDYSLVNYVNSKKSVKIICKDHGVFEQLPHLHKNGSNCPYCAGVVTYTNNEIVELFKEVHKNRYNYEKVEYSGIFNKVIITCKKHGDFEQIAKTHKNGSGCPECAITIGHTKNSYIEYCNQHEGKSHLYLICCFKNEERFYKIGISRLGANMRFDSKLKMPYSFDVIQEIYGDASLIWDLEKSVHKLLFKYKYKPQLEFHGKTECFSEIPKSVYKLIQKFNNGHQLKMLI